MDRQSYLKKLSCYPLFDESIALSVLSNDKALLLRAIKMLAYERIPDELRAMDLAMQQQCWDQVAAHVHTLKGSGLYCGTIRLQHACEYFEQAYKEVDKNQQIEQAYQLLCQVVHDTQQNIVDWVCQIHH